MKILITSKSFSTVSKQAYEMLEEAGFTLIPNPKGRLLNEDEMLEYCKDVDAIILGTEVMNKKIIDNAKNLKVIARYGVGVDKIDTGYLKEKGIPLLLATGANTESVADHTVGLMLSIAHNIALSDRNIRKGLWKKPVAKDLYESTVGIVGLGAIGRGVARRVKGFNCRILAFDKFYDEDFVDAYGIEKVSLDTLFVQSDFITLHIPALEEFTPLINEETFSRIKEDAVIVNTARAKLIDKESLYSALYNGRLYGYGSDVHYVEPGFDNNLILYENTTLTPHIAASSQGAINQMSMISAQNILNFFSEYKEPIKGVEKNG